MVLPEELTHGDSTRQRHSWFAGEVLVSGEVMLADQMPLKGVLLPAERGINMSFVK